LYNGVNCILWQAVFSHPDLTIELRQISVWIKGQCLPAKEAK